jgi:hypothetical protein
MSMGGGGGTTSGGGTGTSTTTPNLYTWKKLLPPWVQAGQQAVLPWLMGRAKEGMLPSEERQLWGQAKDTIASSGQGASQNLSRQLAMSGLSPSSPMAAGGFADLASDQVTQTSKAALDFAKMKMGARDTAIGQLLTALYTPPPSAVGSTTTSNQTTNPTNTGGGK